MKEFAAAARSIQALVDFLERNPSALVRGKDVSEENHSTFKLALGMLDYCNHNAGKDITPLDLVMSMGEIIDHLLKKEG